MDWLISLGIGIGGGLIVVVCVSVFVSVRDWIRTLLFYRSHSYETEWPPDYGSYQWDFQWEDERFTLRAKDVHNDWLIGVSVTYDPENLKKLKYSKKRAWMADIPVSNRYNQAPSLPIDIRVNSITRMIARQHKKRRTDEARDYRVYLDVRRKRPLYRVLTAPWSRPRLLKYRRTSAPPDADVVSAQ